MTLAILPSFTVLLKSLDCFQLSCSLLKISFRNFQGWLLFNYQCSKCDGLTKSDIDVNIAMLSPNDNIFYDFDNLTAYATLKIFEDYSEQNLKAVNG